MYNYLARASELRSQLTEKVKSTYVDFGQKLVVRLLSPINQFARHLIVLQGKDPDYVPPPEPTVKEAVSKIRPSFRFNETLGWSKAHLKNPAEYHPILRSRNKLEQEGGLRDKAAEELAAKAAAEVEALQRTAPEPDPIEKLRVAMSQLKFDTGNEADVLMDEIEVTSGTRAVSKVKVAAKKTKSTTKKAVRVKRTKRGVFNRVED